MSFRHRMYAWHRKRVVQSFERLMVHESRMFAYLGCGTGAWIMQSQTDPERFALRAECCHDRWCPACAKSRAMVLRCNLEPLIKGKVVRFITLTLKHDDAFLTDKLDRLHECFQALRKLQLWKNSVVGGVAFIEVKHNSESRAWHPHIHVLCVGTYLRQDLLKAAWLAVTGDSSIVDIRLVKDETTVARYVTKYLTKPGDNSLYRDDWALDEAIRALKGRRLVTTFGTWRGHALLKNASMDDWTPVMPWPDLLRRCRDHDPVAIAIYTSVCHVEWIADETHVDDARPPPF